MERVLRAASLALVLAGAGACTTTFEGERPSALYGQHIDAAVGLYGPWDEALNINGKNYYLWRRKAASPNGEVFCELRIEVTSRRLIAGRLMQGFPEACALFTAKFVPSDHK